MSRVEPLLRERFNQQHEVPATGQQSSYLTAGIPSAQDINKGTETYSPGCTETCRGTGTPPFFKRDQDEMRDCCVLKAEKQGAESK